MKHNFKIGDRVKIRLWDDMAKEFGTDWSGDIKCKPYFVKAMKHLCGRTATIMCVEHEDFTTKVRLKFDDNSGGIAWQYSTDMITPLVANKKIIITTDGKTTTAKMYNDKEIIKTATARCSSDDEFDFETGANIAFDRLMFNFKVGDKVKIIGNRSFGHAFKLGDLVTIINVDCDGDLVCENSVLTMRQIVSPCDVVRVVEPKNSEIKIGDRVMITNTGYLHTTYCDWVCNHINDKRAITKYNYNRTPTDLTNEYTVIAIAPHGDCKSKTLAYIECDHTFGGCYLIDIKGLKKC